MTLERSVVPCALHAFYYYGDVCPQCVARWKAPDVIHGTQVMKAEEDVVAKTDKETFDLTQIPFDFERRLGMIFREGELKYGRENWRKGIADKTFQLERANHALKHLKIYIHRLEFGEYLGERGEDDLAKVAWFCATQAELERLEIAKECEIVQGDVHG